MTETEERIDELRNAQLETIRLTQKYPTPLFDMALRLFPTVMPAGIKGEHKRHALTHSVARNRFLHGFPTVAPMELCVDCFPTPKDDA